MASKVEKVDGRKRKGRRITRDRERWRSMLLLRSEQRVLAALDHASKIIDMALRHKRNVGRSDLVVSPNIAVVGVGETNDAAFECFNAVAEVVRNAGGWADLVTKPIEAGSNWALDISAKVTGLDANKLSCFRRERKKAKDKIRAKIKRNIREMLKT